MSGLADYELHAEHRYHAAIEMNDAREAAIAELMPETYDASHVVDYLGTQDPASWFEIADALNDGDHAEVGRLIADGMEEHFRALAILTLERT